MAQISFAPDMDDAGLPVMIADIIKGILELLSGHGRAIGPIFLPGNHLA